MLASRSDRLRSLAADWARRRQGDDAHAVKLKRHRIYILPTRFGIAYAAVIGAMLLGSLNYSANLGFALTFLLAGLGLVLMHHCHNNLLAVTVRFAGADPVFAGEEARFRLILENTADVARFDIVAKCSGAEDGPVDLDSHASAGLILQVPTETRGITPLPRFTISTRYPASLFRAWTWIHMDAGCLVYPDPAPAGRPMPAGHDTAGARASSTRDEDDFVGLREASPADPPRRLAWKAYARSDQLLAKQFAGGAERPCLFDYHELPELDIEARLSQLARWCLEAAELQRSFGLVLPDTTVALGSGERHLHDCLQALALFGRGR
jgi:uncharacterized protein (DUF58 family)